MRKKGAANAAMYISIINASARKNGATAKILKQFAENLSSMENVEISMVHLSDIRLSFCLGCCMCYKTGLCHINDDAERISNMISDSDGVIIGTPNYASSMPGQLKTFIDRGHFVIEQLLRGKHAIGVVTYENADGGAVAKALKKLFVFSGAKSFDKFVVKLPFNADPLADTKTKLAIQRKSVKLHNAITKSKNAGPINALIHFAVFNFGIKPFVLRKGDEYKGVRAHWEKRGIPMR